MKVELEWQQGYRFEARVREHRLVLDVASSSGKNEGPSPKEYFLASIAGCAGMDVAGWLQKHRVQAGIRIVAHGVARDAHPRIFPEIDLAFEFTAPSTDAATRAVMVESVRLSLSRYCGVSAMVRPEYPIHYTVLVNGEIEARGKADFEKDLS